MTHPSKRKGNDFERECVHAAHDVGLLAKRAYASNGESLGYGAEVDVTIAGRRCQCKIRKSLPAYLQIPDGCDVVLFRQARGPAMVLMRMDDWLETMGPNHA